MPEAAELECLRAQVAALVAALQKTIRALEMDAGGYTSTFWREVKAPLDAPDLAALAAEAQARDAAHAALEAENAELRAYKVPTRLNHALSRAIADRDAKILRLETVIAHLIAAGHATEELRALDTPDLAALTAEVQAREAVVDAVRAYLTGQASSEALRHMLARLDAARRPG